MPDASGLHCPNCGAAAEPEAGRCPFCKARLATVACPSCYAAMFDGASFCSRCGAARARRESGHTVARCPGCRAALHHVDVGTAALLECAACDGVWVDASTFEQLCTDQEAQAAVLHRWTPKAHRLERVRYRPCVRCDRMMNRVNFAQLSGTVVDVCRGHGTYLDAGELHRIVTFIHGGGLERARERQIEDLREKARELKELADPRAGRESSPGAWSAEPLLELINLIGKAGD